MDQIDTIERLMIKLKNSVKDKDQIHSLPIIKCIFNLFIYLFFTYVLKVIIKNYYLSK